MAVDVLVPPVGTNVDVVTLSCWHAQEGDTVTEGAALFAVETDKASLDIESPASGILRAVTAKPGDEVAALSRIAVIATSDEPADAFAAAPASPAPQAADSSPVAPAVPPAASGRSHPFISPRARKLAEEHGLAWGELAGSGPEGAIVERDVRAAVAELAAATRRPAVTPVARRMAEDAGIDLRSLAGSGVAGKITRGDVAQALAGPQGDTLETVALSGVRAITAERMAASSSTAAAVTLTTEVDATALVEARAALVANGSKVSYNDLLLAILGRALREHPRLNATLVDRTVHVWRRIDIGLAVDTDRGLLVPVVRGVDRRSLGDIGRETARLVSAVREGRALPDELTGGTFTLTNLGMFRIDAFTPIINMPECAILGVGRIKAQPAIVDGQVAARQMMWLSLTFDHRVVDGGPAARFLQRVAQLVEHPILLME